MSHDPSTAVTFLMYCLDVISNSANTTYSGNFLPEGLEKSTLEGWMCTGWLPRTVLYGAALGSRNIFPTLWVLFEFELEVDDDLECLLPIASCVAALLATFKYRPM